MTIIRSTQAASRVQFNGLFNRKPKTDGSGETAVAKFRTNAKARYNEAREKTNRRAIDFVDSSKTHVAVGGMFGAFIGLPVPVLGPISGAALGIGAVSAWKYLWNRHDKNQAK